jgi:hypothetical protein
LCVEAEETVVIVETVCVFPVKYELRLKKELHIKHPACSIIQSVIDVQAISTVNIVACDILKAINLNLLLKYGEIL